MAWRDLTLPPREAKCLTVPSPRPEAPPVTSHTPPLTFIFFFRVSSRSIYEVLVYILSSYSNNKGDAKAFRGRECSAWRECSRHRGGHFAANAILEECRPAGVAFLVRIRDSLVNLQLPPPWLPGNDSNITSRVISHEQFTPTKISTCTCSYVHHIQLQAPVAWDVLQRQRRRRQHTCCSCLFMLVEKITYVSSYCYSYFIFNFFMVTVFAASSKCAQTVCTGRTPKYCTVGWVLRCGTRQDLLGFNLC